MALVGKLLEEPWCPRREAFGKGLPGVEAFHGLFEKYQPTFDQFVFGHQAFNGFHDVSPSDHDL
jgi:hypothetical protein